MQLLNFVIPLSLGSGGSRNGAMGGGGGGGGEAVGWGGGRGARVHPLASKGVWGSTVSSPIGVWGGAPEAFTSNPDKNQRTVNF